MPYPHLFSPLRIGSLEVRNRIAMSPMGVAIIDGDGMMREPAIRYYEERARGGAGMIITEPCVATYPRGAQTRHQPGVSSDDFLPGLRELCRRVHRHGAAIAMQLVHHGKVARLDTRENRPLLMPSEPRFHGAMDMADDLTAQEVELLVAASGGRGKVQPASMEDIETLVADFATAVMRAREAGFDAVEIHAAHGYVISEFLSPAWNHRDDEYGGSTSNRTRLLREVIAAAKTRAGADYPIWCRLDAVELRTPGGISLDDASQHAQQAVAAGADAVHVSCYADATSGPGFTEAPLAHQPGAYTDYAAAIKRNVGVPVITVGRIEPDVGERLIAEGKADVIAMARKMLADPEIAAKLRGDRAADVRPCIYSYKCVAQPFFDRTVHCAVNPAMGREVELADIARDEADASLSLLVIGAGPAGLEAARIAAARGHAVTQIDRAATPGGLLRYAGALYEPNQHLLTWLIGQVEQAGVDLRLETTASSRLIAELAPAAVIVATGAQPRPVAIPGGDLAHVLSGYDAAAIVERSGIGKRVIVAGHDHVAVKIAVYLQQHGHQVTVLSETATHASTIAHPLRWRLLDDLRRAGATLHANAAITAIGAGGVVVASRGSEPSDFEIAADTVVLAGAMTPAPLVDPALDGIPLSCIGDAREVGNIETAIASAQRAVLDLELAIAI